MPDTYIVSSADAAKKILEQVNYPVILKFPQGAQGKGVMFAESFAAASSMLDAIENLRRPQVKGARHERVGMLVVIVLRARV